ncbi:MAG: hypothetical protein A2V91_05890, partial [Candidatus Muproteobacteria bacterium RBG_16_64_10]
KKEIEQLDANLFPLQQGLSAGNYVLGDKFSVMILGVSEDEGFIHAKAGIFYNSILAGCACADDPTPISELSEYCEVRLDIDKKTAETTVVLLTEESEEKEKA